MKEMMGKQSWCRDKSLIKQNRKSRINKIANHRVAIVRKSLKIKWKRKKERSDGND